MLSKIPVTASECEISEPASFAFYVAKDLVVNGHDDYVPSTAVVDAKCCAGDPWRASNTECCRTLTRARKAALSDMQATSGGEN